MPIEPCLEGFPRHSKKAGGGMNRARVVTREAVPVFLADCTCHACLRREKVGNRRCLRGTNHTIAQYSLFRESVEETINQYRCGPAANFIHRCLSCSELAAVTHTRSRCSTRIPIPGLISTKQDYCAHAHSLCLSNNTPTAGYAMTAERKKRDCRTRKETYWRVCFSHQL